LNTLCCSKNPFFLSPIISSENNVENRIFRRKVEHSDGVKQN